MLAILLKNIVLILFHILISNLLLSLIYKLKLISMYKQEKKCICASIIREGYCNNIHLAQPGYCEPGAILSTPHLCSNSIFMCPKSTKMRQAWDSNIDILVLEPSLLNTMLPLNVCTMIFYLEDRIQSQCDTLND